MSDSLIKIFLVSDIFGLTPALETICNKLSKVSPDLQIIDPYNGVNHKFETQTHAYEYFMDRVGLKKYQDILTNKLTQYEQDIVLIGFSVGASAIWKISHQPSLKHVQKAFCFYGSQIRQNIHIHPIFDIELIFPKQEPHFNVDELINLLHKKALVTCIKTNGLHGFMNELSTDFNPDFYKDFIQHLRTYLAQLKNRNP